MLDTVNLHTKPTSMFPQEASNFQKVLKPKVKSFRLCTLEQSHNSGLQTASGHGLKCKLHNTVKKGNLLQDTHSFKKNFSTARKDSIESLIEQSRFSLEKIIRN